MSDEGFFASCCDAAGDCMVLERKGLFTCGEADRSRHGKCCSSSCCCWGDHFHFTSLMYTQKGCEKKNLCQKK